MLKDSKEKNKLIIDENDEPGIESTKEDIDAAIMFVKNDCEISPPIIIVQSLEDWTKHMFFTWGVIAFLLDAEALLNFRNTMPISDGTVGIDDTYKAGPYSSQAINLWNRYRQLLKEFKIYWNLMNFPFEGTSGWSPWSLYGSRGYY